MYTVRDGQRELRFEGTLLSKSTSGGRGINRWVEFELYRTLAGVYILSRVGESRYYHAKNCSTVQRNKIKPAFPDEVNLSTYLACETCRPSPGRVDEALYPERPRYWAQVSDTAEGVVASLYKIDDAGALYMTNVARRLLEAAALKDDDIKQHYYVEVID